MEEESAYLFFGEPEPDGSSIFLYQCVGTDTLYLTPPLNDYAVFPIQLTHISE